MVCGLIEKFGSLATEGRNEDVMSITLSNAKGMTAKFITYGATLQSLTVADKAGHFDDVVLGFDDMEGYLSENNCYMGCIVGRVTGRTDKGWLPIDGKIYQLSCNENARTHLHGGAKGLHNKNWKVKSVEKAEDSAVELSERCSKLTLTCSSPDGECGYPGNVDFTVIYSLYENRDEISYEVLATTDQTTAVNVTNHTYFNLGGHAGGAEAVTSILNHGLYLPRSRKMLTYRYDNIPTGEIVEVVKNGPYDFCSSVKEIGLNIKYDTPMINAMRGFDIAYVVEPEEKENVMGGAHNCKSDVVACLMHEASGRLMECTTTQATVHIYTGNWINEGLYKQKTKYSKWSGCAIEMQNYTNAANERNFPSVILKPNEIYRHRTGFRFSCDTESYSHGHA